jgi:hypothetical protein
MLARWVREGENSKDSDSLPDITQFNDFYYAWEVYKKMKGMDWRFLPDGHNLLDQDEALWSDLSKIASLESKIEKAFKKPKVSPDAG